MVVGPIDLIQSVPAAERIPIGESATVRTPLEAGRTTGLSVETAVQLAMDGEVQAVVTGPVEKRALHLAGYEYPGHTEWLAALAGGVDVAMMLWQALDEWWGIEDPRLAICALNPHAGEGGLFGDEDERILEPAAQELHATGPLPADTVFVRALRREFDAVLTPYHDVGMTAVKVAGFGKGVNVTLGLPFIRTAPDHGTAFDIAGKGIADPSSMREAVKLAVKLAMTI